MERAKSVLYFETQLSVCFLQWQLNAVNTLQSNKYLYLSQSAAESVQRWKRADDSSL